MMMKYRFNGIGPVWGTYGVQVLKLNDDIRVVLSDLPENLGTPLLQVFDQVATQVVRLLMDNGHVENPATVHWIAHASQGDGESPEEWVNVALLWRVDAYVRAIGADDEHGGSENG